MRLKLVQINLISGRNTVLWLSKENVRFAIKPRFYDISNDAGDSMSFNSTNLWQLTFKVVHIGGKLNRLGHLSFFDELANFFVFDPGYRNQKVSQKLEFSCEVRLCTRSTWVVLRRCALLRLDLCDARLQAIVDDCFKGRRFDILLIMVDFIQDVKSDESLVFLEQLPSKWKDRMYLLVTQSGNRALCWLWKRHSFRRTVWTSTCTIRKCFRLAGLGAVRPQSGLIVLALTA